MSNSQNPGCSSILNGIQDTGSYEDPHGGALIPVTIKQLELSTQWITKDGRIIINGFAASIVRIVGKVKAFVDHIDKLFFTIYDGTGEASCVAWKSDDLKDPASKTRINTYVEIICAPRVKNDDINITDPPAPTIKESDIQLNETGVDSNDQPIKEKIRQYIKEISPNCGRRGVHIESIIQSIEADKDAIWLPQLHLMDHNAGNSGRRLPTIVEHTNESTQDGSNVEVDGENQSLSQIRWEQHQSFGPQVINPHGVPASPQIPFHELQHVGAVNANRHYEHDARLHETPSHPANKCVRSVIPTPQRATRNIQYNPEAPPSLADLCQSVSHIEGHHGYSSLVYYYNQRMQNMHVNEHTYRSTVEEDVPSAQHDHDT
ncbi:hypothetical protein ACP70R_044363 [Stipagrostis hirtigluma subsp. patula]